MIPSAFSLCLSNDKMKYFNAALQISDSCGSLVFTEDILLFEGDTSALLKSRGFYSFPLLTALLCNFHFKRPLQG